MQQVLYLHGVVPLGVKVEVRHKNLNTSFLLTIYNLWFE